MHWFAAVGRAGKKPSVDWRLLERKAREHFGIRALRPGQRDIIEKVMLGGNVLGIMPTGAGKSLCYQLPSLLLPKATVVVSPLISLMQDQQEKMAEAGVEAQKIDSTLSVTEERYAVHEVKNGHAELIYVTPERLENPEFLKVLMKAGVSLLVVDEAHCVSQWGHDFRPAFLSIRQAAEKLGNPPILALTATATPEVAKDIKEQLGIQKAPVFNLGVDRENLKFEVYRTVNEDTKYQRLLQIIKDSKGVGIVYVTTVKQANELRGKLLKSGIVAGKYHGKMKMLDREDAQHDFMENRFEVIVATKAFGLGIDKPDVRFVVHYNFPDSVESYYQEAGRAGRDGKKATAALLYRIEDKKVHQFFLGGKYPTRADAEHLYLTLLKLSMGGKPELKTEAIKSAADLPLQKVRVLLAYLEKEGLLKKGRGWKLVRTFESVEEHESFLHHYDERTDGDRKRIEEIMRYGQSTECRAQFFRVYFGDPKEEPCGTCDNCRGKFLKPKPVSEAIAAAP